MAAAFFVLTTTPHAYGLAGRGVGRRKLRIRGAQMPLMLPARANEQGGGCQRHERHQEGALDRIRPFQSEVKFLFRMFIPG
jgi:hypothetical protein